MQNRIVLLLISFFSILQSKGQGSLSSGLVLYLPFNGNTLDISGLGNNARNFGASLTTDGTGRSNSAFLFDGSTNYMTVPDDISLSPQEFSLCAKIFPTGFYKGLCYKNDIINKSVPDFIPGQYCLRFDNNYKHARGPEFWTVDCSIYDTNDHVFNGYCYNAYPPKTYFGSGVKVHTNTWYCAVLTADRDSIRMYVNNTLTYTYQRAGGQGYINQDLFIGHLNNGIYPYWFKGKLDEIRIYNRALSQEEVNFYCSYVSPENVIKVNFKDSSVSCFGKQFTDLSSVSTTPIKFWRWDFGDGNSSTLKNPNHIYTTSGTFNVKLVVTDSNGYVDSITKSIIVGTYKFAHAGHDTIICTKDSNAVVQLNASGGISYMWSPNVGLSSITIPNPIATIYTSTIYVVTVIDANGCIDKDSILITLKPASVGITVTPKIITGCVGKKVQLRVSGAKKYSWYPSYGLDKDESSDPLLTIAGNATYVVTGTDTNGCVNMDTVQIIGFPLPNVKAISDNSIADCNENAVTLTGTGAHSYSWTPAIYAESSTMAVTKVRPPATTVFKVIGIDENGCEAEDTVTVFYEGKTIVKVPSAFTPNNDQINDYLRPIVLCDFIITEFRVYSRWGDNVYISKEKNPQWNGEKNGSPCGMGVYYYMIKGTNSKNEEILLKGNITLIR